MLIWSKQALTKASLGWSDRALCLKYSKKGIVLPIRFIFKSLNPHVGVLNEAKKEDLSSCEYRYTKFANA